MRVPRTDPKHGVADICEMDLDEIYSKGKQQKKRLKPGVFFAFGLSGNWVCRSQIWPDICGALFQA